MYIRILRRSQPSHSCIVVFKDIETALHHLVEANEYLKSFGSWFKVTIESVRKDRRTMKNTNMQMLLSELKDAWNNTCNDLQIKLDCEDIVFRCFPYEIESIINNLIANSTSVFKTVKQQEKVSPIPTIWRYQTG